MHLIEDIVDALLFPFKMLSQSGEIIGLIITLFAGIIWLLWLPIRMSMLIGDLQEQLNEISMFINAIQWLSNEISYVSNASSLISNTTLSIMGLTVLGFTIGNILYSVVGLLSVWLLLRFLPEISH